MIIAGSEYCDQEVISKVSVGDYVELAAEPDNPQDKNAVALYYQEKKLGYVAKADVMPIKTGLKLGRKIYGVITDIHTNGGKREFEYEAWYSIQR